MLFSLHRQPKSDRTGTVCDIQYTICNTSQIHSAVCATLFSVYCVLCTVYCTHCILHTVHCILHTVYCILCTVYCALDTVYSTFCTVQSALYTVNSVLCILSPSGFFLQSFRFLPTGLVLQVSSSRPPRHLPRGLPLGSLLVLRAPPQILDFGVVRACSWVFREAAGAIGPGSLSFERTRTCTGIQSAWYAACRIITSYSSILYPAQYIVHIRRYTVGSLQRTACKTLYAVRNPQYKAYSIPCTVYRKQYTCHNEQYTLHNIQYTAHIMEDRVHSTQYPAHSAECTPYKVYGTQCTLHSTQYIVHSVQYTVSSAQCTVYSIQCTVHFTQYTVYVAYNTQCTAHSIQYTV